MAQSANAVIQQLHAEHAAALCGYCLRLTNHDHVEPADLADDAMTVAPPHILPAPFAVRPPHSP